MAANLLRRRTRRPWSSTRGTFDRSSRLSHRCFIDRRLGRGSFVVCYSLYRSRDTRQRGGEIGQIDQGEQQPRDPEDVDVGEEREQPEHGDDLELQLLTLV